MRSTGSAPLPRGGAAAARCVGCAGARVRGAEGAAGADACSTPRAPACGAAGAGAPTAPVAGAPTASPGSEARGAVDGVGSTRGVATGVGAGAAVRSKPTLSAWSAANSAPAGRSISRTRAVWAALGACTAASWTLVTASRAVTRLESATASCVPSPSVEAYQATRSQPALASPSSFSSARPPYHAPGSTTTVCVSHFVDSLSETSIAARPAPSRPGGTAEATPPLCCQPSIGTAVSKPPFTSASYTRGTAAATTGVGRTVATDVTVEVGAAVGTTVADGVALGVGVAGGGSSRTSVTSSTANVAPRALAVPRTVMRAYAVPEGAPQGRAR